MRSIFDGIATVHGTNETTIISAERGAEMVTRSIAKHSQKMVNREETLTILAGLENAKGKRELRAWQDVALNLWSDVVQDEMQLSNAKAARDFEAIQEALVLDGIIDANDVHQPTNKQVAKFARTILRVS